MGILNVKIWKWKNLEMRYSQFLPDGSVLNYLRVPGRVTVMSVLQFVTPTAASQTTQICNLSRTSISNPK